MTSYGKFSEDTHIRTETHGKKMFTFTGPRILNQLKDLTLYKNSNNKKGFVQQYKKYLINIY